MGKDKLYRVLKWLAYLAFALAVADLCVAIVAAIHPKVFGAATGVLAAITCLTAGLMLYAIVDLKNRVDALQKAVTAAAGRKEAPPE